ncbi:aspartic proteinase-like protein 2 isoform X1 [Cucurbita pepo subsp. pepo]|uniref:aspartic proteinase-like protein 2 isoform X1 n=1 Tax=Cucurbita pepo subsp. pepo TaxID=3664 RepID=UPI000C9D28BF|nr:aspartic proteinase-like protein 2 isoform X1 [Cucurbita pepo subsp. pepo]
MVLRQELLVGFFLLSFCLPGSCNLVFEVQHKFKGREKTLNELRSHDVRRHGRLLSIVDLELGGNGQPAETGLFFARIGLGTPPNDYYVQVDTGSDVLWVNCMGCSNCPEKSDIDVELRLFDPKGSSTAKFITCDQSSCSTMYGGSTIQDCKPDMLCRYTIIYGDGSATTGDFVKDYIHLQQVVGNHQTTVTNGSIEFGCATKQSGELGTASEALDGIIGFGQANSSIISQLAASGKVKKIFAHCLDSISGGGIFAIGDVVEPTVKTTPVIPHQVHYNVVLNGVKVGETTLDLPVGLFETEYRREAIIDSGTTLAYLPGHIYHPLMQKILGAQPGLKLHTVDHQFTCFKYDENVDDGFPLVTLLFVESLTLIVYPHEYLFQIRDDMWCIGWQNSGTQSRDGREVTLLGDLVLQNKLIYYNLENQTLGWIEYNCTSGIKLREEKSGKVYTVGAHRLSSPASIIEIGRLLPLLLAFTLFFIQ